MSPTIVARAGTIGTFNSALPDCVNGLLKDNLVCNTSAPWWDRAKAVVDLFTPGELVANLGHDAKGAPRIGLSPYNWWSEALHGVASSPGVKFENGTGEWSHATSFPMPINLGASFDDDLVFRVGEAIATEARAFANGQHAGLDYWTPNINPFRDPRWGRGQETPGEDPLHVAGYASAYITGLQGPDAPNSYKVIAQCKHFAGYDMESWGGIDRFHFDAQISTQDLAEYYTLPFRTGVRDAKVGSVMCSYNSVNGVPSCANPYFMKDILREHWGFGENWITGDCKAIQYIAETHGYVPMDQATSTAINAGADTDCGSVNQATLGAALKNGLVTEDALRLSVTRLYGSLVRTGYFDPPETHKYGKLGWSDVDTPEHRALALESAEAGIVLLKNDGLLPISLTKYPNVALVGHLGNATIAQQGNYHGVAAVVSPEQGLKSAGFNVTFVPGTSTAAGTSTAGFQAALNAAAAADIVVFAGGIDESVEGEWGDRTSITWPGVQLELVRQLAAVGKPIVVLQFGGGQVDGSELKSNAAVNALLWAGYLGQSGGTAVANILTGVSAPAGRLSLTQYAGSYVSLNMTDMTLRPSDTSPGRTHSWYTGTPVYPFGYGLHYTSFKLAWSKPLPARFHIAKLVASHAKDLDKEHFHTFTVAVSNTGAVASDFVALLFTHTSAGPQPAPLQRLAGYARAKQVSPGKAKKVNIPVTLGAIARADEKGSFVLYPGKYDVWVDVGKLVRASFELVGKPTEIATFPQPPAAS